MGIEEGPNTEWDNDRKWSICISAGTGLFLIVKTVWDRKVLLAGWPNLAFLAAIVFFVIAAGLCYRKEWSRWALLAVAVFSATAVVRNAIVDGPTLMTWFFLIFIPFGFWTFLKMPITGVQAVMAAVSFDVDGFNRRVQKRVEDLESRKSWQIELAFHNQLQMTSDVVASAIARVTKLKFTVLDREIDPVDAAFLPEEHPEPTVAGQSPVFVCSLPPDLFSIYFLNRDASGPLDETPKKPHSWLKIELLPQISRREATDDGYQKTGQIASAFISAGCLHVTLPEAGLCVTNKDGLRTALLSEDPHSALLQLMD